MIGQTGAHRGRLNGGQVLRAVIRQVPPECPTTAALSGR